MSAKNGKEAEEGNKLMKEPNSDAEERKREMKGGEGMESATDHRPSDGIADSEEMNIVADEADTQERNFNDQSRFTSEEGEENIEENDKGISKMKSTPVDGLSPDTRGDEDEIVSEQVIGDEEETIPDEFYYDSQEHFSKPMISDDSSLPSDVLSMVHSFGYDCFKRANLHVLQKDVVAFAAGNYVQIVNLKTKKHEYIRSTCGGGIGALMVHPTKNYLAVAEKGTLPNINIYEYPSLRLYRILRGGTQNAYSYVDFSPDGKLMASVGSDPDYMLTLWDWKQEKIVLRSKAFSQDIFRVTFSVELDGQLTSSGIGHIRFWKMARTFTGLKLQGQLGKFGKKEISDIEGYVELPDGKVLSGSEWGNMLLWDGGLIKVEICRKNKRLCHQGTIQQIIMDEGELMTIGNDGYIRVWDFETVDNADTNGEMEMFEMEPMNELRVGSDVQLRCLVKSCDPEETTFWYAQDANGGIWRLDLSFSFTSAVPEKLFSFHAGPILQCAASPTSHLVATIGVDSTVRVYDYLTKASVCIARFNLPGTALLWPSKTVDSKGSTILSGFEDGVFRVLSLQKVEGTDHHGRRESDKNKLILKQALKPHKGRIVAIDIDSKGQILATGSRDCTVFFMNIADDYEPIGFVAVPSAVTHIQWSPAAHKRNTLLVCCFGGEVLEINAPEPGKFDTSHTFQIEGLIHRRYQFKSIKSVLRHEEELARMAAEEEERKKQEEEEERIRQERGIEKEQHTGSGDSKDKGEAKEEPWEPYVPAVPSPILCGFYAKTEGKFWLSMGEFDAGYLYECEFLDEELKNKKSKDTLYEPIRAIPVQDSNDFAILSIRFSSNSRHMFLGMENGVIRIQPVNSESPFVIGPYWSLTVHDNSYGKVNDLCSSFDDKYLFSVGTDGNFFMFEMMSEKKLEEVGLAKAKIPSARRELTEIRAEDIADPKAYSIEDAKQKSEYDKMLKEAEAKKVHVRQTVNSLRDKFKALINRNNVLPKHIRINVKEFVMDPEIKKELQRQTSSKLKAVEKEMQWEAAKHQLALDKISSRFKDSVECEFIVVKAFLSDHEVSSFRCQKLSQGFFAVKEAIERRQAAQLSKEGISRQETQIDGNMTVINLYAPTSESSEEDIPVDDFYNEIQKWMNNIPKYDIVVIIGDWNAKVGNNYITWKGTIGDERSDDVQEAVGDVDFGDVKFVTSVRGSMGERIVKSLAKAEEKKRKRLANQKQWQELLSSKPDADYEDPAEVAAIKEAKENMGDYKLKSAADYIVPDHLRMNTEKARIKLVILKELIHDYKQSFNGRLIALRDRKISIISYMKNLVEDLGAVQGLLSSEHAQPIPEVPALDPSEIPTHKYECTKETILKYKEELNERQKLLTAPPDPLLSGIIGMQQQQPVQSVSQVPKTVANTDQDLANKSSSDILETSLTQLELKMKESDQIRLLYKRDCLIKEMTDTLKNFDCELLCLRHEKFLMDIDMKMADLRHMTLYEEFMLLKDFEKRENDLASKVEEKQEEKTDMQNKIVDAVAKLDQKRRDIEKLLEREKIQTAAFLETITDNKFAEFLTKVYKKKIRRSKTKAKEGQGGDEDSDEGSEDDSDYSESEEESESESESGQMDLDACPPGCDQSVYDNTCLLREKRLDVEEALTEEKKNRDAMTKDLESMQKKAKVIETASKAAEQELEAFQLEKQHKLNELDVIITLNLHQVEYIVGGILPDDLSQCLVFEALGVTSLQHRIQELMHEQNTQKTQKKDARKRHVELIKDRRIFNHRINAMKDECDTLMMQKFGCIVDIEKLEAITFNRQIEEAKERLAMLETVCYNELIQWDENTQDAKNEMTMLIRKNTVLLNQLTMLYEEKKQYERNLDERQIKLGTEFSGLQKSAIEEHHRLVQLVHYQAQEIESMKDEMMMLSRKGGHILPPAQRQRSAPAATQALQST